MTGRICLVNPRGFCAGVSRAISIVDNALARFGAPVYVRHEVVHNRYVVDTLRQKGAVFIEELAEVPDGAVLIFSAHGVPMAVEAEAKSRNLTVFDATCPLVSKVHVEVRALSKRGAEVIMIGHRFHPEVEATLGQYDNPDGGIYLVDDESQLDENWFTPPPASVGVTAGASAPDILIEQVVERLRIITGYEPVEMQGIEENRNFEIPKELRTAQ